MSCNQNYYATKCLVKVLPMMNQSIESTESWDCLIYVYQIFDKLSNLN